MIAPRGLVLAIAISSPACALDGTADETRVASQHIIGGGVSDPSEFPATGLLVVAEHPVCTATLIRPDVVLTAAHCLSDPIFGGFGFTLDTDATDGIDGIIPAAVAHQHPEFDDGVDDFTDLAIRNDVGVLVLDEPILDVEPEQIEQPADGAAIDAGAELSLCGYGRSVWHVGSYALKRDAQVFVDRSEPHEFSTTAVDPQPCNGDSGGPLFAETANGRRIVGVVSRAVGRSMMCDTGAIITRIGPYNDWIYLASHDHNTGGCTTGRGGGAALPVGLIWLASALRRRRRGAR